MNNHVDLAFTQVVKRIEPATRFDRTSFKQESNNVRVTRGKAHWQFTASISNEREEHPDRLPYHATRVDSAEKLDEVAQQSAQAARNALASRIATWLKVNEKNDRELQPSDCFDGTKTFGHEYKHSVCGGDGRVRCDGCKAGYNDCGNCNATGHVPCHHCRSLLWGPTGKEKCRGCRGSREINGHRCPTCNGKGEVTCTICRGVKTLVCKKCKGDRRLVHSTCRGTGWLTCQPCKGTGYFHIVRRVSCAVHDRFTVELKDPKAEVVEQLVKRNLVSLRTLASVTQENPTARDNVAQREYQFECAITEIGLHVAEKKLQLIGFGNKAQIFDFKRIVAVLLAQDLLKLEQTVAKTHWRLWGTPADLIKATSVFLDSEVNLRIDDSTLLRDAVVDRAYVTRVKTHLPRALGKIMTANLGLAYLLTFVLPLLTFFLWYFVGMREAIGNWVLLASGIVAIITWVVLEFRMRTHLRTILNDKSGGKVDATLHRYYILWMARGVAFMLVSFVHAVALILP